ncbi:MAG: hypothetical protein Q4A69_06450 [Moraxella sp.]|nr:hypothetical protein [Moraxella sp.]
MSAVRSCPTPPYIHQTVNSFIDRFLFGLIWRCCVVIAKIANNWLLADKQT